MGKVKASQYWFSSFLAALASGGACLFGYWLLGIEWIRGFFFLVLFVLFGLGLFSVFMEGFMIVNEENERKKDESGRN